MISAFSTHSTTDWPVDEPSNWYQLQADQSMSMCWNSLFKNWYSSSIDSKINKLPKVQTQRSNDRKKWWNHRSNANNPMHKPTVICKLMGDGNKIKTFENTNCFYQQNNIWDAFMATAVTDWFLFCLQHILQNMCFFSIANFLFHHKVTNKTSRLSPCYILLRL